MNEIKWEKVHIAPNTKMRRNGDAFASITPGNISFSATASNLIEDVYQYKYVDVLQGIQDNRIVKLGFDFHNQKNEESFNFTQRKYKGNIAAGITIYSKNLVERYFGSALEKTKRTIRYKVERENNHTISIALQSHLE